MRSEFCATFASTVIVCLLLSLFLSVGSIVQLPYGGERMMSNGIPGRAPIYFKA